MNCIYFTKRTKKYKAYFFCRLSKQQVTLNKCKNCSNRKYKEFKAMKNRTKKQAKLERQRDEGLVKSGICGYCGKFSKRLDPHEVYGGSNRQRSIKHKFVKLICSECHSNENVINQLRKDTQKEFEKTHTREEFIRIVGKSYL